MVNKKTTSKSTKRAPKTTKAAAAKKPTAKKAVKKPAVKKASAAKSTGAKVAVTVKKAPKKVAPAPVASPVRPAGPVDDGKQFTGNWILLIALTMAVIIGVGAWATRDSDAYDDDYSESINIFEDDPYFEDDDSGFQPSVNVISN